MSRKSRGHQHKEIFLPKSLFSILLILSYTVSKSVRFLRHNVLRIRFGIRSIKDFFKPTDRLFGLIFLKNRKVTLFIDHAALIN